MELKKIRDICWNKKDCIDCPLYEVSIFIAPEGPVETEECLLHNIPQQWNVKEIERRLENYGKEKSTDSGREI